MGIEIQIYFSDFFGVSTDELDKYGAFDVSLINDLPMFIDPFLLFNSDNPRYQQLHRNIIEYLKFLRGKSISSDIDQGLIDSWYSFPEVRQNWFGYSEVGNYGRGLGREFGDALHSNLHKIFSNFGSESITQSSHLEKLCLIKPGVGRDNISDFTTNLIKGFLLEYTQTFAEIYITPELLQTFSVPKTIFNYKTESWETRPYTLPVYENEYVLLTPKNILTRDETWINNTDFRSLKTFREIAQAVPNLQLRAQINNYLDKALADPPFSKRRKSQRDKKKDIQAAIEALISQYPELIDYYVRYKEDHKEEATADSEQKVAEAETIFIGKVLDFTQSLYDETAFYEKFPNTYEETHQRIAFLKDVIENKGGHRFFYMNGQPFRRESDIHILFRLVWFATLSDITMEANDGRGPVDSKISRGSKDKTLAEFKLASNSQLKRNLQNQAEIYEKASDAKKTIKVIFYFSAQELRKVEDILKEIGLSGNRDVVLIDARSDNKPSGSKA